MFALRYLCLVSLRQHDISLLARDNNRKLTANNNIVLKISLSDYIYHYRVWQYSCLVVVGGRWRFIKRFWIIDRWTWLWTLLVERCERQDMTKVKNGVDAVDTLSLPLCLPDMKGIPARVLMSGCLTVSAPVKGNPIGLYWSFLLNQTNWFSSDKKWTSYN